MTSAQGIDVSHWKPVSDWGQVRNAGINFIGIKATEGASYVDPMLQKHREGFRQQPFELGIFFHFGRSGDPTEQAEHFLATVGQLRDHERFALDLEVSVAQDTIAWVDKFFDIVTQAHPDRTPLIYTSDRIWRSIGNPDWARAETVDLWVPRYSEHEPTLPKPWSERGWVIWQSTDSFECPGVTGLCDGDLFYGDTSELVRYASLNPRIG